MKLQDSPLDWESATDEECIQALFNPPEFVDPRWMSYLERERPHVVTQYLQMWQAQGSYMSPIARRRLRKR